MSEPVEPVKVRDRPTQGEGRPRSLASKRLPQPGGQAAALGVRKRRVAFERLDEALGPIQLPCCYQVLVVVSGDGGGSFNAAVCHLTPFVLGLVERETTLSSKTKNRNLFYMNDLGGFLIGTR